jgi:hypothetical protein
VDAESEWRKSAADGTSFNDWLRSLHETGAGWFDYLSEELDRHYASELVSRLEQIVERASTLDTVQIKVNDGEVKKLFREAHEAYLYGFDIASIALCRSLLEHALRDRLSIPGTANIKLLGKHDDDSLINRAGAKGLLKEPELTSTKKVARTGNDVMHNVSSPRGKDARDVVVCTRMVLNHLYA